MKVLTIGDRVATTYGYWKTFGVSFRGRIVKYYGYHKGVFSTNFVDADTYLTPHLVDVEVDEGGIERLNLCWFIPESYADQWKKYGFLGKFLHNLYIRWMNFAYFPICYQMSLTKEK